MPKTSRSFRCLLLVLLSASLPACNSSGGNSPAETGLDGDRPTVVSSDAVTISDNNDSDSQNTSDPVSNEPVSNEPVSNETVPGDAPGSATDSATADPSITNDAESNTGSVDEINTIEDLLAHLEARRNQEQSNTEDSGIIADPSVENPSVTEPETSVDPAENNLPDETSDLIEDQPVVLDQQPVDITDGGTEGPTTGTVAEDPDDVPVDETGEIDLLQEDPAEPQDTIVEENFSSDKNEIVVDCDHQLPCEASNNDGAVAVVVENVYRHPETRRLAIALSVTANRDTALRWDNDITSTDDVATTYNGTTREFSGFYQFDRDNDMVTLLAGTTLLVVQHFREMPLDTTVSMVRFDTGYIEAGVRTALQFSNMPLDPVLGDIVDCADQVPCTWVANDQSYAVNVLKTSGLWQTGRLRIDFEVRSTVGMALSLFSSEPAVGNDGSVFTPRTHSLSGTSDYQEFSVQLVPEGVLAGFQDFLKNANRQATSLVQVKLGMTRVNAPGAGSPVFRNLPLE